MSSRGVRRAAVRLAAGLVISAVFAFLTISRVDLIEVAAALGRVDIGLMVLAVPVVGIELVLRGMRWQRLLQPLGRVVLRRAVAYLAIGYFANSMLPARLGDVARALLAGRAFGIGRLTVLGTIVVERLADGLFILGLVALLGLVVTGGESLATTAIWLATAGVVALAALAALLIWIRRAGAGRLRSPIRYFVDRVILGVEGIRSPRGAAFTAVLTVAAFGAAVAMFSIVARAAGADLTIAQSALVMGGLALTTSIPAGPGSIGTYEFIGLTMLTSLGLAPEPALAVVVLVHLVATLPVAIAGLLAAWRLHFRFSEIQRDSEPANLDTDAVAERS